jgi:hypothetical protein
MGAGAGAGAGVEGAVGVDAALLLLDFSLLKTLLILFTYFPRLLRRSTSFVLSGSAASDALGVDMFAAVL